MNIIVKVRNSLIGQKFGKLIVIEQTEDYISETNIHRPMWVCRCECGKTIKTSGDNLKTGHTKSCGCIRKENAIKLGRAKHKINIYDVTGEYGIGYTSNQNDKFYFDLEDFDKIKTICWNTHTMKNGLKKIEGRYKGKYICMHEFLGYKNYDHINRNELDNRKLNLRQCTQQENSRNRSVPKNNKSGYIGVCYNKRYEKWNSYICIDGKQYFLGYFSNKFDALRERLKAEKQYFGEFAPQRHLFEEYNI